MSIITITAILVTLCAIFSYINYRFIKLPTAIGIMVIALSLSLFILFLPTLGIDVRDNIKNFLEHIDFTETLMNGMLSFLLFAGALHVNINDLSGQKWIIGIMAIFGTIFSTIVVGFTVYYLFPMLGFDIPFIYALVFGSLISPTDPVAVMAILKKAGVPKSLETKVVGESLFNDGVAVVIFMSLLAIATEGNYEPSHIAALFVKEAIGGIALGFFLGYTVYKMLATVDNYQVEILLTLALVMGGYELSHLLHTSGPLAMVVAGVFIGNQGKKFAMSDMTWTNLSNFWELCDEFLNAVLFLLIGFEIFLLTFDSNTITVGLLMIPILLTIRLISVWIPISLLKYKRKFSKNAVAILTWGGLRGGISVALVLSLPEGEIRNVLLLVTYCIVVFSIIVQGITMGAIAR